VYGKFEKLNYTNGFMSKYKPSAADDSLIDNNDVFVDGGSSLQA
jgi:hypothetical protein